jgi:rod shape-determining protein MreC
MINFLSENRAPALVVALLVASLLLLSYQVRVPGAGSGLQAVLLTVFAPVARGSAAVVDGTSDTWHGYLALRDMRGENLALRRTLTRLQVENQLLADAAREGDRLRALLLLQQDSPHPTVAARVVALELDGPFRVAVLDRGRRHGIQAGDGVIAPSGVVGRVTASSAFLSKIQFITDPSSGAAAVVERTRVQGMVVGRGVNRVEMQYVSALADVEAGDMVTTSGLDGIYPGGLRVGRVVRVGAGEGLQRRIAIQTAVDFSTLEEVLILVSPEPTADGEESS